MIIRYCITIFLGLAPFLATAQPALIVRLDANAPAGLYAALEDESAGKQSAYAPLLEGIETIHAIGAHQGAGKQWEIPFAAYTLTVTDSATWRVLQARWAAQPGVAYVQPNHHYQLDALRPVLDDPLRDSLAYRSIIRVDEAWATTTGRPDVRIGFIDTGVYLEHPDLRGQFWVNPGEDLNNNGQVDASDFNGRDDDGNGFIDDVRGYDFVDRSASVEQGDYRMRDPDPSDDNRSGGGRGHGTLIAGVLGAGLDNDEGIAGVAPGCRLVPLRAFGADGLGEDDDVAAAIIYAAQMGIDVLNLSFGDVYYSPLMEEAISYAVAQGTVVVASAGNLGGDDPHYPSDYPEVISVAWLDAEGTGIAGRGAFGLGIDLGAPGSSIYTTLLPRAGADGTITPNTDLDEQYGRRSGSSMAAPMVSGAAALVRSVDPGLTPAAVQNILTGTAADLGLPGWDHRTGAGRLDVAAALERSLPARVEISRPAHDTGWAGDALAVLGSAVTPSFASYSLYYAEGDEDLDTEWQLIAGPVERQHLHDTLAVWQTGTLPEGTYTLRLTVALRTGKVIEDRRRVFLDRSAPLVDMHVFHVGLVAGRTGIVVDLSSDDLVEVEMQVTVGTRTWTTVSDRRAYRHSLAWQDEVGRGGTARVHVTVANVAGLQQTTTSIFTLPASGRNTALFQQATLTVPHGYLLTQATDFDGDGLKEITLNRYQDGWIGDTLSTYEWDGTDFRLARQTLANVIPRAVGDPDGDGLLDLLTQVAGASLVLEQPAAGRYPSEVSFIDTTGLANPFDPNAAFGARLTDLDDDGRGEILVHNTRQWRVLEYNEGAFLEVARLENPTGIAPSEISQNEFQQPLLLVDDFDGDGRQDLVVGDGDGDWIVYEVTGDNALDVAWTYETGRYNAGARFASGDFDGDGLPEFVTFTQNWTQPTRQGDREPDVGLYYFWDQAGDDTYVLTDSLPIPGLLSRHGSMLGGDFDGDARDELVLVHAPHLYVLAFDEAMRWSLRFELGPQEGPDASGARSVALVADDFDGDGRLDLIAGGADESLHRYSVETAALLRRPPLWARAVALDDNHTSLAWHAAGADSVTVYRSAPGEALDAIHTTSGDSLIDQTEQRVRYVLRGWFQGVLSPVSEERFVRPHAPAVVEDIYYPEERSVALRFSEPLATGLQPHQFRLDAGGAPTSLLQGEAGHSVILRFNTTVPETDVLRWTAVYDKEGTAVASSSVAVTFPTVTPAGFIITEWQVLGSDAVRLTFSEPLDPGYAADVMNYRLNPSGRLLEARWSPDQPEQVTLAVADRAIGATGLETSLLVLRMRSAAGASLAREGSTISLTQAAENLDAVYVFPNPYRMEDHASRMMIAGLPVEATIFIFSIQGDPVRRLEESDGDGGVAWDLRDEQGRPVPSGIYLIRVEATDQKPVLRKAAIIK